MSHKFGQFCGGEPWKFVNWPAEFGKIFHRKLRALQITFNKHAQPTSWYFTMLSK